MQRVVVVLSNHSLETVPVATALMHSHDLILLEEPAEEAFLPMLENEKTFPKMVSGTIIWESIHEEIKLYV